VAVVIGLLSGFLLAVWRPNAPFRLAVLLPLCFAVLELVVNAVRFGWRTMPVWTVALLSLTVAATAIGRGSGAFVRRRSERSAP
jgi:hypothetical protein